MKIINHENTRQALQMHLIDLRDQPEYLWGRDRQTYATVENGEPDVKVAIANSTLDFDMWKGLRNPAQVGLYPAGLEQIWEFWANSHKKKTDEDGRSTIFQLPPSFESAKQKYQRAVIISVMLPVAPEIVVQYNKQIRQGAASWPTYRKVYNELNQMADQLVTRMAIDLNRAGRAVVVMNGKNVKKISQETIPMTHQNNSHGVCKGGNYSQKSIAALTGLGQFGVTRLVFRDELVKDQVQRFIGPIRSIIIFDEEPVVTNGMGGITHLNDQWLEQIHAINDFTNTDPKWNQYRYCTHIPGEGEQGCAVCLKNCPSEALVRSAPDSNGEYAEAIKKQGHRFYEGALQFDYANCHDENSQKSNLYDEWICGHCVVFCGSQGVRRRQAAEKFAKLAIGQSSY